MRFLILFHQNDITVSIIDTAENAEFHACKHVSLSISAIRRRSKINMSSLELNS